MPRPWVILLLAGLLCPALLGADQTPTRPSESTLKQWLVQLTDADPDIREKARYDLLGLNRADLPRLRQVVVDSAPLAPSQSVALREIVTHVFLTGEPFEEAVGAAPFLGITMTEGIINVEEADPADRTGVTVGERMPGFAAYRALRDGDVIIGIEQIPPLPIRSPSDLVEAIRIRRPGDTIRLRVLRGANLLSIPVVLGPRPLWAERFGREEILARQQAADAYWQRHFAGLVQRPLS